MSADPAGVGARSLPTRRRATHLGVVVPARDEEELLPACLDALEVARRRLARAHPDVAVAGVVVLDRCTDGSARVAQAADWPVVAGEFGGAGAARAAGVVHVRRRWSGVDPASCWLATTDADSRVPADWLVRQADWSARWDCVVGTVEPEGIPADLLRRWRELHRLDDGHPHVHGANLGVAAAVYDAVGGFGGHPLHEDVDLVTRLRAAGAACLATDEARVVTSGRLHSRVAGGFADYLADLARGAEPDQVAPTGVVGP